MSPSEQGDHRGHDHGHVSHRARTRADHEHRDHAGHAGGAHAHHSPELFRARFWLSLLLALPILYFSEQIQSWFGYQALSFPGVEWVNPALGTVLFVYDGSVFLRGARPELAARRPGMMTLSLIPHTAHRLGESGGEDVLVTELRPGDVILVRPGEQIAADGNVTEGRSSVNESFLTGESRPVTKEEGDAVVAGAVNGEGAPARSASSPSTRPAR